MPGLRYADAGVNIDNQDETTRQIKSIVRTSFGPEVLSDIGLFGGLYAPDWKQYREPVLVASTDSVGSKLKVAFLANRHDTVGLDIVAHCANDILVQGARPLFFLDYIGMGVHDTRVAVDIVRGATEGCRRIGCALIGGELAELAGFYTPGEYDLVGTIVGIVDRDHVVDGSRISVGDRVIGLASDGLHTNGYSLARKVLFEMAGYTVETVPEDWTQSVGNTLLQPHRCYVNALLPLLRERQIDGLAHITGGGLVDNMPRILPDGCGVRIKVGSWPVPQVFETIRRIGGVEKGEMYRTFNMGIGMVAIVSADRVDGIMAALEKYGETPYLIGEVCAGEKQVEIRD